MSVTAILIIRLIIVIVKRKAQTKYFMNLLINEIFYSIQGESTFAGLPCIFVRLTGCNLRCRWCDSTYAYENGEFLSLDTIIEKIGKHPCRLVEVTGGEPLLQENTPALVEKLLAVGYRVLIETNGSQNINLVSDKCHRIVDFKCPGSNMHTHNDLQNIDKLTQLDEVKFVISNREDYLFSVELVKIIRKKMGSEFSILFSPVMSELEPSTLAEWILQDNLEVRLQLQLHKIIWGTNAQGV